MTDEDLKKLVDFIKEKNIQPCIDGFYILQMHGQEFSEETKKAAFDMGVLIDPTREELKQHLPRQTYYCDHMFDKKDASGCIVMPKDKEFWAEHEGNYRMELQYASNTKS